MRLDVLAACPLAGRFVLECLEYRSPPEMRLTVRFISCSKNIFLRMSFENQISLYKFARQAKSEQHETVHSL